MTELLSNDRIAELVAAAKEGELPAAAAPRKRARRVRTIDFSLPTRFTLDQKRRLERAHKGFCRAMGPVMSAELGTPVEYEVIDISQVTYAAAVQELPPGSISGTVRLPETDACILLAVDGVAAAKIVHRMLGGNDAGARLFDPEPTQIELGLLRRLFETSVGHLSREWEDVAETVLELDELDLKLANVEIAPRSEPCLAVTIEIRMDDSAPTMAVVIPYAAIDAIAHRLDLTHDSERGGQSADWESVLARLRGVEVEAHAEVAATELPLAEILELRPGDLVPLGVPRAVGVSLAVGSIAMHRCLPGRNGRRRAIEIVERLEAEL